MSRNRKYPRTGWRKIRPAFTPIHSTLHQAGTDPSASALFADLVHSLKEATTCRTRLSRLLPGVFGPAASTRGKTRDPREEWRQKVIRVVNKVYRELDGLDKDPMPLTPDTNPPVKHPALPSELSELDHNDYHALAPDAQGVVRNEYSAWKTWQKVLQKHKEAFEKQFPNWEQMDSPASAQLRHLWSLYGQAQLGLSGTTVAKGGLLVEVTSPDQGVDSNPIEEQFLAGGTKVWGEPPPGVSLLEHITRCSVLASRGLPLTYPSQNTENSPPGGEAKPVESGK